MRDCGCTEKQELQGVCTEACRVYRTLSGRLPAGCASYSCFPLRTLQTRQRQNTQLMSEWSSGVIVIIGNTLESGFTSLLQQQTHIILHIVQHVITVGYRHFTWKLHNFMIKTNTLKRCFCLFIRINILKVNYTF